MNYFRCSAAKTGPIITIDGVEIDHDVNLKKASVEFDVSVSTLPYDFRCGGAVIYNNEIHILGGDSNKTKHYKYDGSTWINVSTLPYEFNYGSAVVYNNEIHILGSDDNPDKHYKYDGSTWTEVSTLPYNFHYNPAVVFNNEIHILGSYDSNCITNHYMIQATHYVIV